MKGIWRKLCLLDKSLNCVSLFQTLADGLLGLWAKEDHKILILDTMPTFLYHNPAKSLSVEPFRKHLCWGYKSIYISGLFLLWLTAEDICHGTPRIHCLLFPCSSICISSCLCGIQTLSLLQCISPLTTGQQHLLNLGKHNFLWENLKPKSNSNQFCCNSSHVLAGIFFQREYRVLVLSVRISYMRESTYHLSLVLGVF